MMTQRLAFVPIIALLSSALAAETAAQPAKVAHVHGTAHLRLVTNDKGVTASFIGPAGTLIGFERKPGSEEERATLALAIENLKAGDGMIRLNTAANCHLLSADVDVPLGGSPHRAEREPSGDNERHVDMKADYRFACDRSDQLDSAGLGFFAGFPFLQRVLVEYETKEGRGAAELTPGNPVVNFVPF
jgi:hypothetical protein